MKEQLLNFQFKAIEIIGFKLNPVPLNIQGNKIFHFNISIEHRISSEQNLVFVNVSADILSENKDSTLGSIIVSCIFQVSNMPDFLNKSDNKIIFPSNIIDLLNSISISTSRGVMYSQFKGTFLHNAILPIIAPKSFQNSTDSI